MGEEGETDHDSVNIECVTLVNRILRNCYTPKILAELKWLVNDESVGCKRCHVLFEAQSTFAVFQREGGIEDFFKRRSVKDDMWFINLQESYKNNAVVLSRLDSLKQKYDEQIAQLIDFLPFNFYETWAEKVLVWGKYDPHNDGVAPIVYTPLDGEGIDFKSNSHVHLVIVGMTSMGVALAMKAAHIAHYPNFVRDSNLKTRITFIDLNADTEFDMLRGRYSALFEQCDYRVVDTIDPSRSYVSEGKGKEIVVTKGKIRQAAGSFKTANEPIDTGMPLAVLVNGNTASASEILSGSMQDLDRAVIIGTRTYGKGLVQTTRQLPYNGTLKVTTSKYYIPSGRCIQAIDYAKKNADGSVARIPDSLTHVFYTAAGREVRDGGGIRPDIEVKGDKFPNILFYLLNDDLIFDYATQYCLTHPALVSVDSLQITDEDYADFKKLVKDANFTYDRQSEQMLKTLKEVAEFEGYMEGAAEEFKALEQKLNHNLDRDLDYFSGPIKEQIAEEVATRYFFERGAAMQRLKDDADLKKAIEVLTSPAEYRKILSVPEAKTESDAHTASQK